MFSVLIPVYNHDKYVGEAILSCLLDELVSEILIVDDGSKDRSLEVIESFAHHPRVKVLDNGNVNRGAHNRLNELAQAATCEWLAVLNSDDAFAPHRFQTAKQIIREKRPSLITGGIIVMDAFSQVIGVKAGTADPEYPFPASLPDGLAPSLAHLMNQNFVATTSNMIFTKRLFDELGGFRDYRYIHDWDFALRAYLAADCEFTPAFLTKYRVHASNTIKENPLYIDGEVTRMFCSILSEHKGQIRDAMIASAFEGNHHVDHSARVFWSQQVGENDSAPNSFNDIFSPAGSFSSYERRSLLAQQIAMAGSHPTLPLIVSSTNIPRKPFRAEEQNVIYVPRQLDEPTVTTVDRALPTSTTKPTVFVLSGFFAIGGVERNTVEIIRQLKPDFDFVVVTFEPHYEDIGSLHHQLDELGVLCVDLAHLLQPDQFNGALSRLNELMQPSAVWIINGSTWLAGNAGLVRSIFGAAKVIDQQVYDTKAGWIQEFHRPGILAADYFIAVNTRIEESFRSRFNIPPALIRQIYPAVSLERVSGVEAKRVARSEYEAKYNLAPNKINVGFIGRLTAQKRPERFIELAGRFMDEPDVQFVLIGTGPMQEHCRELIIEKKVSNIRMIEFFEDVSDVGCFLDGLVICSDFEGLPIALLECMSMAIPFFSTDVGDIKKITSEYGGGVVIENWDDGDVVPLIRGWLADNAQLRMQLEGQGLTLREDFSARQLARQYKRLFEG